VADLYAEAFYQFLERYEGMFILAGSLFKGNLIEEFSAKKVAARRKG